MPARRVSPGPADGADPAPAHRPRRLAWSPVAVPRLRKLGPDMVAGLSVALVLIPQSLAYAQLAGVPPQHGLYAAALAPIAAAPWGSSRYLQTGPTAATALLVLGILDGLAPAGGSSYAALAALLAVLVGGWRLLLGLVRGGQIAYLLSQPVMVGFVAAAGLLIVGSQVPALLGTRSESANPLVGAWQALREPAWWHLGAMAFGATAVLVMTVAKRALRFIPPVLIAVTIAVVASGLVGYTGPTLGPLPTGWPSFDWALPWHQAPSLLLGSWVIALVGYTEPAVIARRYATADRQHWNSNRELISQGLANVVAGFGGGLPVGGSFSRTALARLAGARSRLSGLVAGLAVLAFLPAANVLSGLPTAVLGAVVVVAVLPLLAVAPMRRLWAYSRPQALVAVCTFVVTLALAPRIELAVLAGIGLSVALHLWRETQLHVSGQVRSQALHVRLGGVLYFFSAPLIEQAIGRLLAAHPEVQQLIVHCDGLGRIDVTGAMALRAVVCEAARTGVRSAVVGVPAQSRPMMCRVLPAGTVVDLPFQPG